MADSLEKQFRDYHWSRELGVNISGSLAGAMGAHDRAADNEYYPIKKKVS